MGVGKSTPDREKSMYQALWWESCSVSPQSPWSPPLRASFRCSYHLGASLPPHLHLEPPVLQGYDLNLNLPHHSPHHSSPQNSTTVFFGGESDRNGAGKLYAVYCKGCGLSLSCLLNSQSASIYTFSLSVFVEGKGPC